MKEQTYKDIQKAGYKYKPALKFIDDLQKNNIPLFAIDVNDWVNCPNNIVTITIPYGSPKNGGKYKAFKNKYGDRALKTAIKFYNTKN